MLNYLSREKMILIHISEKKKAKQIFILRAVELRSVTGQLAGGFFQ